MPRHILRFAAAIVFVPALLSAQDTLPRHIHGGEIDSSRIGLMSPMVVQQRLRLLGYTHVSVVERGRAVVQANARKRGRAVAVRLDPRSGKVTEVPGRFERRREEIWLVRPNGRAILPPR